MRGTWENSGAGGGNRSSRKSRSITKNCLQATDKEEYSETNGCNNNQTFGDGHKLSGRLKHEPMVG